jgi:stearoyl-CoA desaturase (delta-9 desaturase)
VPERASVPPAAVDQAQSGFEKVSIPVKIANLTTVVVPFVGLIAAMALLWGRGFSGLHLGLLIGMYLATVFGVTIGYHRLFTHRAFETSAVVKAILAFLGSLAIEGPLLRWVAIHRKHHQASDTARDPHSPHSHGDGFVGFLAGLWHAHCGWLFSPQETSGLQKAVADLKASKLLRTFSNLFPLWILVSLLIPTLLGGLLTMSWMGALLGFLWGGLARIFLVHHVTWSINSVCHLWGRRPYRTQDESRNNLVFGLLAMGEGWHNNHHAFPTSARHGLAWWQIDVSYLIIRLMEVCGLAWQVRLPAASALAAKRRTA